MNVYRISRDGVEGFVYKSTQAEAHGHARSLVAYSHTYIDLLDLDVDKSAIVHLLSTGVPLAKVIKSWGLTPRGGLKEVDSP